MNKNKKLFNKRFFILLLTPLYLSAYTQINYAQEVNVIDKNLKDIYSPIKKINVKNNKKITLKTGKIKTDLLNPAKPLIPVIKTLNNPEDRIADDLDISTYNYIDNAESSIAFFNLILNSVCSKSPDSCNDNDLLIKLSKEIVTEIKKNYPLNSNFVSEEQTKYLLMNSVTLKDKLGKDKVSKINQLKNDLKSINDSIFKEKRDDIIKKSIMLQPKPSPSTIILVSAIPSIVPTPIPTPESPRDKIVFVSERDGNPEIYTMNTDGTNPNRLTNNSDYDIMPSWFPDGKKIVFVSERDGNPEIYNMNTDGTNPNRLTNNSAYDYSPNVSPDGAKIIFVSNRENVKNSNSAVAKLNFKIFIMNADGTNQVKLFEESIGDESPKWSPDGKKIAFVSNRDGNSEIYICNADGTGITRLTNNPSFDIMPSWSPDGKKIAFRSDRDGNPEIYTMNPDGTEQKRITMNLSSDESPAWSPDNKKILFVSRRDNIKNEDGDFVNEIYVMNADSSDIFRLTNNTADDYSPSWYGVKK